MNKQLTSVLPGLTPREIVSALDRYIVGQDEAKRAVAVAIRNRARRKQVEPEMREEIAPKNIIMIGPTGVGKTEIARRLSALTGAPFIKVEATKYTEVGYVGRDVESMIRDLTNIGINMVRREHQAEVAKRAEALAEDALLDLLLPGMPGPVQSGIGEEQDALEGAIFGDDTDDEGSFQEQSGSAPTADEEQLFARTREKMQKKLRAGELEDKIVELEVKASNGPMVEVFSNAGLEDMDINFQNILSNMMPVRKKQRKMKVGEARTVLIQQETDRLIDMDRVTEQAIERVENMGIVFIDEIDKIAGKESSHGPDVSREGVQRDILPIIEGCTVNTRYGPVKTDHILFIAAGAFHVKKPSDLIPELQGRFPIRVELAPLARDDLKRILTKPRNALVKQYEALLGTEGIRIRFDAGAVDELARIAEEMNNKTENIGARRLHTILEKLLEDLSFQAPDLDRSEVKITRNYVKERIGDILEDRDLSNYIL